MACLNVLNVSRIEGMASNSSRLSFSRAGYNQGYKITLIHCPVILYLARTLIVSMKSRGVGLRIPSQSTKTLGGTVRLILMPTDKNIATSAM